MPRLQAWVHVVGIKASKSLNAYGRDPVDAVFEQYEPDGDWPRLVPAEMGLVSAVR